MNSIGVCQGLRSTPGVGRRALEPRVAADDGAARVGLGAQVLQALVDRRGQGRTAAGVAAVLLPPVGQAVAERDPQREGEGAESGGEREDAAKVQVTRGGATAERLRRDRIRSPRRPGRANQVTKGMPRCHSR